MEVKKLHCALTLQLVDGTDSQEVMFRFERPTNCTMEELPAKIAEATAKAVRIAGGTTDLEKSLEAVADELVTLKEENAAQKSVIQDLRNPAAPKAVPPVSSLLADDDKESKKKTRAPRKSKD